MNPIWLNYTGEKQIHYPQFHPNSDYILVYYINKIMLLIIFLKKFFLIYAKKIFYFNPYNANTWWL